MTLDRNQAAQSGLCEQKGISVPLSGRRGWNYIRVTSFDHFSRACTAEKPESRMVVEARPATSRFSSVEARAPHL